MARVQAMTQLVLPFEDTPQPAYGAILTPQDIRRLAVARGYRWCAAGGHWFHKSADGGNHHCGLKRRRRQREGGDDN